MLFHSLADRTPFLACLVLFFSLSITGRAQNLQPDNSDSDSADQTTTTSSKNNIKNLEKNFFRNLLSDQKAIWTSPLHLDKDDAKWAIPLTASFATLWATDRHTSGELVENGENEDRIRVSNNISKLGAGYTTGSVALGTYLIGIATHNAHARETGLLAGEALINASIVSGVLKVATQRERPPKDDSSGEFYDGGSSFPSGHAVSIWSVATVFAEEYGQHRLGVKIAAYSVASAVSIARYTGRNHFLSDVLVGSAIGYGVGCYVYHEHHDRSLDSGGSTTDAGRPPSNWMPGITPVYSARLHTYGVGLRWSF